MKPGVISPLNIGLTLRITFSFSSLGYNLRLIFKVTQDVFRSTLPLKQTLHRCLSILRNTEMHSYTPVTALQTKNRLNVFPKFWNFSESEIISDNTIKKIQIKRSTDLLLKIYWSKNQYCL